MGRSDGERNENKTSGIKPKLKRGQTATGGDG